MEYLEHCMHIISYMNEQQVLVYKKITTAIAKHFHFFRLYTLDRVRINILCFSHTENVHADTFSL